MTPKTCIENPASETVLHYNVVLEDLRTSISDFAEVIFIGVGEAVEISIQNFSLRSVVIF